MEQHLEPFEPGDLSTKIGINTLFKHDINTELCSKVYSKIYCTPKSLLREVFSIPNNLRGLTLYSVLLLINDKPLSTANHIALQVGSRIEVIQKAVRALIDLKYIKIIKRRTFIIPFNAYKIDKTYVITPKGKIVLNKLINY